MGDSTSIEWTQATWNPVTGCTKISDGCKHCYAERLSLRLKAMGQSHYINGFEPTMHEDSLRLPLTWKRSRMIFVNSMSDLFHEAVSDEFIISVFNIMAKADRHTFQVLTKRPTRLAQMNHQLIWSPNIWMGVTVENLESLWRIEYLRKTDAAVKFISAEPLLGSLSCLELDGIGWVIVGGESGPGARVMEYEWVTQLRDQCIKYHTPFFFKQWGGTNRKKAGRLLDERPWDELPGRVEEIK